jgi:hypothetical protein
MRVSPVYYRLLLRFAPLTGVYGNQLIDQALLERWPEKKSFDDCLKHAIYRAS